MASLASRLHLSLLTLALIGYGAFSFWAAISGRMWDYIAGGLIAVVAAIGVITNQRWAKFVVYALAAFVVIGWLWYVWLAMRVGYFTHRPVVEGALALAPGLALVGAAAYCCYVASKYGGASQTT
jgi:hypothetical protein